MKKIFTLIFFTLLTSIKIFGQCPNDIKVQNITLPTCGNNNGKFDVKIGNHSSNVEVSINGGVSFSPAGGGGTAGNSLTFTGLTPALYHIIVRVAGSHAICQSFDFVLRANYGSAYTAIPSASSNCSANGSIVLGGGVLSTDSVSWLSNLVPTFVTVGSLTANTIPNLIPGVYYVIFKSSAGGNYCYSTHTITVGNTGISCPSALFCGNAADPNNLFPNGTFGSGGNADGTNAQINGPPLPAGLTQYTYQPLGAYSPEDGFYAIANNTYAGTDIGNTTFSGTWYAGYDHDYVVTGIKNGYMLVVNASYDPDIVIQETINNLCPNKKYQFSAYIRDLNNTSGYIPANLTFLVNGVGMYTTGDILTGMGSPTAWQQVGFTFQPSGSTATISIRNNQTGGLGNDWALDDIYLGDCVSKIVLQPDSATCINPPAQVNATITDATQVYTTYQWQVNKADGNGFINDGPSQTIPPGGFDTNNSFTTNHNLPNPLTVLNNGWQYRLIVGTSTSDLSSATCYYSGNQTLLVWGCEVVLPLKFIDIKAVLTNNNAEVLWRVSDQLNIDHYEIEKSNDGKNFSYVASVPVNSGLTGNYFGEDNNLFNGTNYYRIKAIDHTGKYSYSRIVSLNENINGIKIFPNPVGNTLSISTAANIKIKSVLIIDAIGKTILKKNDFSNSLNTIEITNLLPGFYNIKIITSNNDPANLSFIKK